MDKRKFYRNLEKMVDEGRRQVWLKAQETNSFWDQYLGLVIIGGVLIVMLVMAQILR